MNNKARRQSFEVVEKAPGGVRGREREKGKATLAREQTASACGRDLQTRLEPPVLRRAVGTFLEPAHDHQDPSVLRPDRHSPCLGLWAERGPGCNPNRRLPTAQAVRGCGLPARTEDAWAVSGEAV